jgi:hypothetical protein
MSLVTNHKKKTCYHITIGIIYDDDSMKTQHFLRKYSDAEYKELYREDEDSEPDWEAIFQSSINIQTIGDMDICEEIISEVDFVTLYEQNGWTWVTNDD